MSQFLLLVLASLLIPGCALMLLLWLAHLEDTLDEAVQRRSNKAAAQIRIEQPLTGVHAKAVSGTASPPR